MVVTLYQMNPVKLLLLVLNAMGRDVIGEIRNEYKN
jgi:hypothetical protein|tara:strand:+ start:1174 stop:1281 length:108 start_codon:yes stop_codon:yes gene_type:complete